MREFNLNGYRRQWPRMGAVLAMAIGGATALASKKLTAPQVLSSANLVALYKALGGGWETQMPAASDELSPIGAPHL